MPGGMLGPPYVSAAGRAKMAGYQYSGRDLSLYYRHVQSPLCDRLVRGLPRWLAPNAITLAGLACTACATAAMLGHSAGLRGEPGRHPWVYYLQAACHIAYQTLDNMDGKQARRTGNASPLGLLFDHGIDAVNYTLMDLGCLTVMQMGGTWGALVLTIAGSMGFYAATWEQMFSGTFTLTAINAPNEGILVICLISVLAPHQDPGWWEQVDLPWLGWRRNEAVAMGILGSSVFVVLGNVWNVYKCEYRRKKLKLPFWRTVRPLAEYVGYSALVAGWALKTGLLAAHPVLVVWVLGFFLARSVSVLMR